MHFALIVIVVSLCGIISGKYIEMSVEVDGKEMVTKILSSRISALLQCGFDKVWWVLPQENTDTRFVELQDVLGMDKDVLRNVLQVRPKVMQLILSHAAARQRDLKNSGMKRPNSATPDEGTELACKKTRN